MPWKALTRSASFRLVCDCWKSASVRSSRQRVVFGLGMAAETKKYRKSARGVDHRQEARVVLPRPRGRGEGRRLEPLELQVEAHLAKLRLHRRHDALVQLGEHVEGRPTAACRPSGACRPRPASIPPRSGAASTCRAPKSAMKGRICSFVLAPATSGCRKPWDTSACPFITNWTISWRLTAWATALRTRTSLKTSFSTATGRYGTRFEMTALADWIIEEGLDGPPSLPGDGWRRQEPGLEQWLLRHAPGPHCSRARKRR